MTADDIPGFDEDPELEDLLTSNLQDLDEETRQEVQKYKSQKLQAKRDADLSTDKPEWWPEGGTAPETLEEMDSGDATASSQEQPEEESSEEESTTEASSEDDSEEAEEQVEEETETSTDEGSAEEAEQPQDEEPEQEDASEEPSAESGETVEVDLSETDFEIDPEMEELLDEDVFDLDEETRQDVQLYKSRKMQAKRDARREAGGGDSGTSEDGSDAEGREGEEGLSKDAPPPTDTGRYKGERKISDLVSSRDSGRTVTRRGFISSFGLGWLAGLTAFSTGAVGSIRYFFPNVLSDPPEQFVAGEPGDYSSGAVSAKYKSQYRVWIVNLSDRIVAINAVCTHLGCTPNWIDSQGIFKCPCHGSAYYKNGVNFAGPAPRPMERVAVRLNPQGKIIVDKSKSFSQSASPGWNAPEAFIKV
ncbi:MAG: Rieske 2Fe-2S domain-containing protein [bacterium]